MARRRNRAGAQEGARPEDPDALPRKRQRRYPDTTPSADHHASPAQRPAFCITQAPPLDSAPGGASTSSQGRPALSDAFVKSFVDSYCVAGETCEGHRRRLQRSGCMFNAANMQKVPMSLRQKVISVASRDMHRDSHRTLYDKAFCAEWLDDDTVVVSTKCGHILRLDRPTNAVSKVPLPGASFREPTQLTAEEVHNSRIDRGGIHSIRMNRTGHYLACSSTGHASSDVCVLDLTRPNWPTILVGEHHQDWVFSLTWISDSTFVTGSRDTSIAVWDPSRYDPQVPIGQPLGKPRFMKPLVVHNDVHQARVRVCDFDRAQQRLVSMDMEGHIALWDFVGKGDMTALRSFQLQRDLAEENTCMKVDGNVIVVGTRGKVSLYDVRRPEAFMNVPIASISNDGVIPGTLMNVAARSLSVHGSLLGVGLSMNGELRFFDKRRLAAGPVQTLAREPAPLRRAAKLLHGMMTPDTTLRSSLLDTDVVATYSGSAHKQTALATSSYGLRTRSRLRAPNYAEMHQGLRPRSTKIPADPMMQSINTIDLTSLVPEATSLTCQLCDVQMDGIMHMGSYHPENAIFSHAWSPNGSSLFSCGGPLAMGTRGCHLAFYDSC